MLNALFIDDESTASVYAELLSDDATLKVQLVPPKASVADLAAKVIESKCDVLCLDYRLDQNQSHDGLNRYKAGPVAQQLRDLAIEKPEHDLPIVLLSGEENIRKLFAPDKTAQDLFDAKYVKETIAANAADIRTQLVALTRAYAAAKSELKNLDEKTALDRIAALISLTGDEKEIIDHPAFSAAGKLRAPHLMVSAIRRHLFDRNGLLVDKAGLFARLGIAEEKSDQEGLFAALQEKGIEYDGILSEAWPRWWTHRLLKLRAALESPTLFGLPASERVDKLNKGLGLKLAPAVSRWTKREDALVTFACASCRKPTELAVSVSAYDPQVEQFSERRRICFSCVATGEYEGHHLVVDKLDDYVSEQIKSGKLKPPP